MRTAVILTARKERDSSHPYPLMPLGDGRCLVRRTLDNLHELGYDNIYMVVGFCADEFDCFASSSVHLIVNEDYAYTASMASLAKVAPHIDDDFLLIEGDVFYEKKILQTLTVCSYPDCLSVTEESGNGDEAFVDIRDGRVVDISKDPHRILRIAGEMLGVSKISKKTLTKMMEAWEHTNNPYVNYEYVLLDVTEPADRHCVRFPNLIWGDVDCRADYEKLLADTELRLFRKENPYDRATLLGHLDTIFGEMRPQDVLIEPLGGMSNRNFKVSHAGNDFVLRVPGYASEGMVTRASEEVNTRLVADCGIDVPLFYFNRDTGVKLTKFIADAETLTPATIQRPDNLRLVAAILRRLHTSGIEMAVTFDVFDEIARYESLMQAAGAAMYEGWAPVRKAVMSLKPMLQKMGIDLCPCHNDLVAENFIKDAKGKLYVIDWEYSGNNDPVSDLAALFLESQFTNTNIDYVLQCYYQNNVPLNIKEKIQIYQILFDYLWAVWTVIKEKGGASFGNYGPERYRRAIENLKKLGML